MIVFLDDFLFFLLSERNCCEDSKIVGVKYGFLTDTCLLVIPF